MVMLLNKLLQQLKRGFTPSDILRKTLAQIGEKIRKEYRRIEYSNVG